MGVRSRKAAAAILAAVVWFGDAWVGRAQPSAAPPRFDRPNILLIVLDTLRYDATSFGDPPANTTPFLASLAQRGVVFTRAYSTHDYTPESHFSILTGLSNGLYGEDDRVENGVPYQLGRSGYDTFDTVANALLQAKLMPVLDAVANKNEVKEIELRGANVASIVSIDQRLAMFGARRTAHNRASLFYNASRMLPQVADQARQAKGPFFGFVNLIDPHEPYVPDPQFYAMETSLPAGFDGDLLKRRLPNELLHPDTIADPKRREYIKSRLALVENPAFVATDLSPEARAVYRARYLGKVQKLDTRLRDFFASLERDHLLDNTVVIITSDHGESFGEADLITHHFKDQGDYESTHHVPLLIVLPPRFRVTSRTVDKRVSLADIAPTIYDLAGIDWSAFPRTYRRYASSLTPLFLASAPETTAQAALPQRNGSPANPAEQGEREKVLRSLGYLE